ncbi:MAG: hypothetical protein M1817_001117 [Caeruleum heppii]|nr:MAG: hypothetical protein M1817_001117 [Caeruleum heppii]
MDHRAMELSMSSVFKSSPHCLPSSDGAFVATVYVSSLVIRATASLDTIRSIRLDPAFCARVTTLRWSPGDTRQPSRILVADNDTIRVWDIDNPKWSAAITSISTALGPPSAIHFSPDARSVLIHSAFNLHLKLHSLQDGHTVTIPSPKCPGPAGTTFHPRTGHLALLTRPSSKDLISLHEASTGRWAMVKCWDVGGGTVDVKGVKWSACGRWLLVWDSVAAGGSLSVYTADGALYRTYDGGREGWGSGLGARLVEWSPCGQRLAVGDCDKTVTLLSTSTFSPQAYLTHPITLKPSTLSPSPSIWTESAEHTFTLAFPLSTDGIQPDQRPSLPIHLLTAAPQATSTTLPGIDILSFSPTSIHPTTVDSEASPETLLATHSTHTPTTLFIWSVTPARASLRDVLVFWDPVRSVRWDHSGRWLLIRCAPKVEDQKWRGAYVLDTWETGGEGPEAVTTEGFDGVGSVDVQWLGQDAYDSRDSSKVPWLFLDDGKHFSIRTVPSVGGDAMDAAGGDPLNGAERHHLLHRFEDDEIDWQDTGDDPNMADGDDHDDTFHHLHQRHVQPPGRTRVPTVS